MRRSYFYTPAPLLQELGLNNKIHTRTAVTLTAGTLKAGTLTAGTLTAGTLTAGTF
jgi:hypothetical protein